MPAAKQHHIHTLVPAIAGCIMLCASLLPWLNDPLGEVYSAWNLPIDIGWQFRTGILNYGLLCTCCALLAFLIAYIHWRPLRASTPPGRGYILVGILCMVPVMLFLLQYLFVDLHGIDVFAQHNRQMLLVQQHFGYNVAGQIVSLQPFDVTGSTLLERLELLVDRASTGVILPFVSALIMIGWGRRRVVAGLAPARFFACLLPGLLLCLVVLGRAPAAMIGEYEAKAALAAGNYASALNWLDTARNLNPALDQVPYFHRERGQAWYFLHPGEPNDDSHIYLASTYREQGDYLDAYQELLAVWQTHASLPWVTDEMSATLEELAEYTQQPGGPPIQRADNDVTALPWLQLLAQVDASNVYAQYLTGRIQYELHNYSVCMSQMTKVVQISHDASVQSSAYTYMGLSAIGQGNLADARTLLLKAVELDPDYHNNTAREELSGLH